MYNVHICRPSSDEEIKNMLSRVGSDPQGVWIMGPKMNSTTLAARGLHVAAANILKQEMLAVGGEAAIARGTVNCSVEKSDAVMHATTAQYKRLVEKLRIQPFGLEELALEIDLTLEYIKNGPTSFVVDNITIPASTPVIVGILNVTPDSFSDGGAYPSPAVAIAQGMKMISEGADIIDIGGESTRPGAEPVSAEEEWRRIGPVVEALVAKSVPVSVDTSKGCAAEKALKLGAVMINDVTAGSDPKLLETVAAYDAPLVLMHMRGTPRNMQEKPEYQDVVSEVCEYLRERAGRALEHGVKKIVLDPGIGFGKTLEHNLALLQNLESIRSLGWPVMAGVSRKSMLGKLLDIPLDKRQNASIAALSAAVMAGADLLRVHDVKESREAAIVASAIRRGNSTKG